MRGCQKRTLLGYKHKYPESEISEQHSKDKFQRRFILRTKAFADTELQKLEKTEHVNSIDNNDINKMEDHEINEVFEE